MGDFQDDVVETAEANDATDVGAALERETEDGQGDQEVPHSDFIEYAGGDDVAAYGMEPDAS